MAKAIDFTPHIPSPTERLTDQVSQTAPALAESLELLQQLHQHGILEVLIKLVRGSEELTLALLDTLNADSSLRLIRNGIELAKIGAETEPHELRLLGRALSAGVSQGAKSVAQGKSVGLSDLPAILKDPDIGLALGAIVGVLKGTGQALREAKEHQSL